MVDPIGLRAQVYYNLHKHCLSLVPLQGYGKGRVQHAEQLVLKDVRFAVQPKGRERVLQEQRKNVHAFVRGQIVSINQPPQTSVSSWTPISYNPYKYATFVNANSFEPVHAAEEVWIMGKQILAKSPRSDQSSDQSAGRAADQAGTVSASLNVSA
jgi:hypothetical protein